MCIRDRSRIDAGYEQGDSVPGSYDSLLAKVIAHGSDRLDAVSYTHLRAHETVLDLVCRLLLEKKKKYMTEEAL